MNSIKETPFYSDVIMELNYPFGNVFIFHGFIVSEVNTDVNYNWEDHGKFVADDISEYLSTNGEDIIFISNRVNSYSVVATDWFKFFKNKYSLKTYFIVSNSTIGIMNSLLEDLFFTGKIKRFSNIETAINFIKTGLAEIA